MRFTKAINPNLKTLALFFTIGIVGALMPFDRSKITAEIIGEIILVGLLTVLFGVLLSLLFVKLLEATNPTLKYLTLFFAIGIAEALVPFHRSKITAEIIGEIILVGLFTVLFSALVSWLIVKLQKAPNPTLKYLALFFAVGTAGALVPFKHSKITAVVIGVIILTGLLTVPLGCLLSLLFVKLLGISPSESNDMKPSDDHTDKD